MESGIQSSFIPHDAGTPQKMRRSSGSGGLVDLFFILGIVAFAASCALAVAVFLYLQYLQSTSASDLQQLQRAQAQFEPTLIQQLTRLDDRMTAANTILSGHLAPSAFFAALNQVTLQTVSFSTLDLEATDPQTIQLKMQGVAQSVNSIALQADLLSQSGIFSDPVFSNIDRQKDGVHFDLTALVNPAALNYEQLTGGSGQSASAASSTPSTAVIPGSTQPASSAPASPFESASSSTPSAPAQ